MSGGVDSSVAALLMLEQGFSVEGVFMKNWDEDDGTEYCSAQQDFADAQAVADKLGIKLHYVNFAAEYWEQVFEIFLAEYRAGRTPNPDVLCNKEIKFKAFLDYALSLGADAIATGHYACLVSNELPDKTRRNFLYKAKDAAKDQSYFLYAVSRQALDKAYFPLGNLTKPEVRAIAKAHGLVTHNKKDSTGICFIGERKFQQFLQQYLPAQPGNIVDEQSRVLGRHQGLIYYTFGQRKGLGLGGIKDKKEQPWFVAKKDLARNILVVVQDQEHRLLMSEKLICNQLHWLVDEASVPEYLHVKVRYRQMDQPARLVYLDAARCELVFDRPQWAVTPGQSAVFYQDQLCLGGGVIESVF